MVDDKTVHDYIADGLKSYKELAKHSLKSRWKQMNWHEKCKAARSLVVMDIVAKEPDCFSRKKTESSWILRGKEYAMEHNLKDVNYAFYFVQDPKGIIWNQSMGAMTYPLVQQYYHFLESIQNYEYARSDFERTRCAEDIEQDARRVCTLTDINKSGPVAGAFKKFVRNFYKER